MSQSKVLLPLCTFSLLAVAMVSHATPVASDGATQRRAELREALQRRNTPQADNVTTPSSEHQLTPEARAELRRQLRVQQKNP